MILNHHHLPSFIIEQALSHWRTEIDLSDVTCKERGAEKENL